MSDSVHSEKSEVLIYELHEEMKTEQIEEAGKRKVGGVTPGFRWMYVCFRTAAFCALLRVNTHLLRF